MGKHGWHPLSIFGLGFSATKHFDSSARFRNFSRGEYKIEIISKQGRFKIDAPGLITHFYGFLN